MFGLAIPSPLPTNPAPGSAVTTAAGLGAGPTRVLGIDPSLTGLALVVVDESGSILHRQVVSTKPGPIIPRFTELLPPAAAVATRFEPALVVMEGLSMGSIGGKAFDRTGLHYLLRWSLRVEDRLQIVAPTTLKKWVCGHGHAEKQLMLMRTLKLWGEEFTNDNECDAYCLARWGLAFLAGEVEVKAKAKKARKKKAEA